MRSILLFTAPCALLPALCFAQPGTWQTHFSYRSAQSVAVVGQNVYAATRNGFFLYNKTTSETRLLTRDNGLSDVSISRVLALPDQQRLMLVYRSGAIDFLVVNAAGDPGDVTTITTIASSDRIPAEYRGINHINRVGNTAYLSTDFGLVVFDLSRNEIRDTYFSPVASGIPAPVLMTAVLGDSLYALTRPVATQASTTIRAVRLAPTTNIADPANWRSSPLPVSSASALSPSLLVADSNRLLASVNAIANGIYARSADGSWSIVQVSAGNSGIFASSAGTSIVTINGSGIPVLTVAGSTIYTGPLTPKSPRGDSRWQPCLGGRYHQRLAGSK